MSNDLQCAGSSPFSLAAGNFHTCSFIDNDKVVCWGKNRYCHLGHYSGMQSEGLCKLDGLLTVHFDQG